MTLREFITDIGKHEQYRVFQPNRDCLIFESFFKIHSPYYFGDDEHALDFKENYYDDNDYCDDVYYNKELDDETKELLKYFGDYIVYRIEIGSFYPLRLFKNDKGDMEIVHVHETDKRTLEDYEDCFDIFIIPR